MSLSTQEQREAAYRDRFGTAHPRREQLLAWAHELFPDRTNLRLKTVQGRTALMDGQEILGVGSDGVEAIACADINHKQNNPPKGQTHMGNWTIIIEGHGCHHNSDPKIDANEATKAFVQTLIKQGHTINRADFVVGMPENILYPAKGELMAADERTKAAEEIAEKREPRGTSDPAVITQQLKSQDGKTYDDSPKTEAPKDAAPVGQA